MILKYLDNIIADTTDSVLSRHTKNFTSEEKLLIDNLCITILKLFKRSEIESSKIIKERFSRDLTYETIIKMLILDGDPLQLNFKKFYSDHKDHREAKYETDLEPDSTTITKNKIEFTEFKSKTVTGILVSSWPGYLYFCDCNEKTADRPMCDANRHDQVHMRTIYDQNHMLTSSCLDRIKKVHFKKIINKIIKL